MAAHASDWGDSLNPRYSGGKRVTIMVMMFVGEVVPVLNKNSRTFHTVGNLRSVSFSFPPEILLLPSEPK